MGGVFVIGLPTQLRPRLEGVARREGVPLSYALAGLGRLGTFMLVPSPEDAIHLLRTYYDQFETGYDDALVVVLPYAPTTSQIENELVVLEELGAEVVRISAGEDGWPTLAKKSRPDSKFFDDLFHALVAEIFGAEEELLSEFFESLAARDARILIAKGALDSCDQVADHRIDFFKSAAEAFNTLLERNGHVGRLDAFFRERGIEHAQSGGITTTLKVSKDGAVLYSKSSNMHLKQGDATTPQSAARLYFHQLFIEDVCHIAILYAGPHPDSDISREFVLGAVV